MGAGTTAEQVGQKVRKEREEDLHRVESAADSSSKSSEEDAGAHLTKLDTKKAFFTRARAAGKVSLLAIDGGGVRGVLPAIWCAKLEAMLMQKTGDPNQVCNFFLYNSKRIFCTRAPRWLANVKNMFRPKYHVGEYEKLIGEFLQLHCGTPDVALREALRPVMVTSYDGAHSRPYFFMSERAARSARHDFRVADVCRATSAAPSMFRPALVRSADGSQRLACIDGGIISNNPVVEMFMRIIEGMSTEETAAIEINSLNDDGRRVLTWRVQAMAAMLHMICDRERFPPPAGRGPGGVRSISDMLVLSLGAGEAIQPVSYDNIRNKGLLGWAAPMLDILVWGGSVMQHTFFSVLSDVEACPDNYFRVDVESLPKEVVPLDNTSSKNMRALQKLAEDQLHKRMPPNRTLIGEIDARDFQTDERLSLLADQLIEEYRARMKEQAPEPAGEARAGPGALDARV
eukprot:jgi/Mesen1/446/ME000101S10670